MRVVDEDAIAEARAEMWKPTPNLERVIELKSKAIRSGTFDKVVLTGEGDSGRQWIDKMMKAGSNFRVDSIKGGLVVAKSWGPVEFRVGDEKI